MNVDGAKPFLMAQAVVGTPTTCTLAAPILNSTTPGNGEVALSWSLVDGATGYRVYYDQAGKAQLVADVGDTLEFIDTGLTNGMAYCYKVTAYDATCESGFSDILCATPENPGQTAPNAGVRSMETGYWSAKGKIQQWNPSSSFSAGDTVIIRAKVLDSDDAPITNATVAMVIGGPETVTLNSGPSGTDGWAEAVWNTKASSRRSPGTAPGSYTATTTNVTASGYHWDGATTSAGFSIQ
jgi:hypothetical protein